MVILDVFSLECACYGCYFTMAILNRVNSTRDNSNPAVFAVVLQCSFRKLHTAGGHVAYGQVGLQCMEASEGAFLSFEGAIFLLNCRDMQLLNRKEKFGIKSTRYTVQHGMVCFTYRYRQSNHISNTLLP